MGFHLWSLLFFSADFILKLVLFCSSRLMSSFQQSQQQQAALSLPLARSTAKALDLAVVLNQSPGGGGEGVSPTSATSSENGEVVGPPGKMKEGRLNAGQAETTGVHCISQHTQQSHTSLPWPLFFLCLKCSSTVILLTNTCVAFKSQITCHLLFATFFVCKITPSLELFLYLIPISIIIRLNWIFFRTINCNYTSNTYSLLKNSKSNITQRVAHGLSPNSELFVTVLNKYRN